MGEVTALVRRAEVPPKAAPILVLTVLYLFYVPLSSGAVYRYRVVAYLPTFLLRFGDRIIAPPFLLLESSLNEAEDVSYSSSYSYS